MMAEPTLDELRQDLMLVGLTPNATIDQLKRRRNEMARHFHPDANPGKDREWQVLSDAFRRLQENFGRLQSFVERPEEAGGTEDSPGPLWDAAEDETRTGRSVWEDVATEEPPVRAEERPPPAPRTGPPPPRPSNTPTPSETQKTRSPDRGSSAAAARIQAKINALETRGLGTWSLVLILVPIIYPGLAAIVLGPKIHGFAPEGLIRAMDYVVPITAVLVLFMTCQALLALSKAERLRAGLERLVTDSEEPRG
jgi:hypothetical protein